MSFRIARVLDLSFPQVLSEVYEQNTTLNERSYEQQLSWFSEQGFVYLNDFCAEMNALGNQAADFLFNIEPLQKTWARQHALDFDQNSWKQDVLVAQLQAYKPDVLLLGGLAPMPLALRKQIKTLCPSVRLVVMFMGLQLGIEQLGAEDLILAGYPVLQREYQQLGLNAQCVYHSFDAQVLKRVSPKSSIEKDIGLSYIGSSGYAYGANHAKRYWLLKECLEHLPIEAWLLERTHLRAVIEDFDYPEHFEAMRPLKDLFPQKVHEPLFGLEMYRALARSITTLNVHTNYAGGNSANMRMFEATGMGCCLLTEKGSNLAELFDEQQEVVAYSSAEECLEKAKYLLENPGYAQQIGQKAQRRTLQEHSLARRCEQMHSLIKQELAVAA